MSKIKYSQLFSFIYLLHYIPLMLFLETTILLPPLLSRPSSSNLNSEPFEISFIWLKPEKLLLMGNTSPARFFFSSILPAETLPTFRSLSFGTIGGGGVPIVLKFRAIVGDGFLFSLLKVLERSTEQENDVLFSGNGNGVYKPMLAVFIRIFQSLSSE